MSNVHHDDNKPKLTGELIIMAIASGLMDESLDAIEASFRSRAEVLELRNAAGLNLDDRFLIKSVRPKKWEGIEVRFTGRENSWLVCEVYKEDDRLNFNQRVIRLKNSHVGYITHRSGK
jgi:hypothetical protein